MLSWRRSLAAGGTNVSLATLKAFGKAGTYNVRVSASTSDSTRTVTLKLKVLAKPQVTAHTSRANGGTTTPNGDGPGGGLPSPGGTPSPDSPSAPAATTSSKAEASPVVRQPSAAQAPAGPAEVTPIGAREVAPVLTAESQGPDARKVLGLALLGLLLFAGLATALSDVFAALFFPSRRGGGL